MSRTTWRVLRTELLRGVAPVAGIAILVVGAAMLYGEASSWGGQWMPLAAEVRESMFVLGALAVGAGAWQVGRSARRRAAEQLSSTARPPWHRIVLAWVSVTIGCSIGLLVAVGAAALLVAPVATYDGGGWWWLIAVGFVALAAMSALGVAVGRLLPYRLTAPIAAVIVWTLQIFVNTGRNELPVSVPWLTPMVQGYRAAAGTLDVAVHLQQILWFGGLATTLLVLTGARRRLLALAPAVAALAGASLLVTGPTYGGGVTGPGPTKWRPDPQARELVCTEDELVCMPRHEAFLLDDVEPFAREVLARFEGVPGGPSRAIRDYETGSPDDALSLDAWPTVTGHLGADDPSWVMHWSPTGNCNAQAPDRQRSRVLDVASSWAVDAQRGDPESADAWQTLRALPEADQKAWIGEVIAAAESCDEAWTDLWARVS